VAGLACVYFGYRFVESKTSQLINQYTDTNAVVLGSVKLTQEQLDSLKQRLAQFSKAMEDQTNTQELALSADDINGLIAADKKTGAFRDRLFVRIEDNRLQGDVSIPLKDFGPIKLDGRFLNGAATFKVSTVDGKLDVRLDEMRVNHKPLPAIIQSELQNKNLVDELKNDPESRKFLDKLASVEIKDGQIIIRNRVSTPPPQAP